MSLQYIIDAYNLINHPAFKPASKSALNIQHSLVEFIRLNKLTGSSNNSLIMVFDGYPPPAQDIPYGNNLLCMFSRSEEADVIIKKIVEDSVSPKNIVVVSDDKEVRLTSSFLHAQAWSVEKFIRVKKNNSLLANSNPAGDDFKLSYSNIQKINAELKKKWL